MDGTEETVKNSREPAANRERLTVSVEEAAEMVGVGRSSMYILLGEDQTFPRVKIGRRVVIPIKALEEWLAIQTQKGAE